MASAAYSSRPPKFVPPINLPQIVALATVPGRMVPSGFGPSEVVFDLTDGRPWYVPQCVADVIYRSRIVAGQEIEVTATGKKKTDLQIVPLSPRQPSFSAASAVSAAPAAITGRTAPAIEQTNNTPGQLSPVSTKFMAAYKDAIDTLVEAKAYAQRQGIALDVRCEDVRCLAATMMIQQNGGGR